MQSRNVSAKFWVYCEWWSVTGRDNSITLSNSHAWKLRRRKSHAYSTSVFFVIISNETTPPKTDNITHNPINLAQTHINISQIPNVAAEFGKWNVKDTVFRASLLTPAPPFVLPSECNAFYHINLLSCFTFSCYPPPFCSPFYFSLWEIYISSSSPSTLKNSNARRAGQTASAMWYLVDWFDNRGGIFTNGTRVAVLRHLIPCYQREIFGWR